MTDPAPPIDSSASFAEFIVPDAARMESLAEFAAGAGHEINNPLATIVGRAQQLLKGEQDPQRRQMLLAIGAQAYRIRDMIGDAMLFGRPPRPELHDVSLAEITQQCVDRQNPAMAAAGSRACCTIPAEIVLRADPTQLSIVLSELLRNSCQALLPSGGDIAIRATQLDRGRALIEVEDHGCGFTDQERIHAFDPFFSGRQAGRGLGFGLPKCWQIIRQHEGTIQIHSTPRAAGQPGTTIVRVIWPLAGPGAAPP